MDETSYCINEQIYDHRKDFKKKTNINNGLVNYDLENNHNFNFQDSKMLVYIHNKNIKIIESSIISNHITFKRIGFFQFISLFGQIGAEKLQNSLFKIIQLHHLYIFRKIDKQIVLLNGKR